MIGIIQPARFPVGGVPAVATPTQVASPTFKRGYPVTKTAGLIDESTANPLQILGFALQDNQTNPGYSAANSPTVITGRSNTASIAVANNSTEFSGVLYSGAAIVAPVAADDGAQYGLTKVAALLAGADTWVVDQSKVGDLARVVITAIDIANSLVFFKVLPAYQQDTN